MNSLLVFLLVAGLLVFAASMFSYQPRQPHEYIFVLPEPERHSTFGCVPFLVLIFVLWIVVVIVASGS